MSAQPPMPPVQPGQPGAETVPTCYRHPGRETYVRCQRCDRPICPDCMREAAVGHQCVECVQQGSHAVRQARTVFGGSIVAKPYVTWIVLGLNLLVFAAEMLTGRGLSGEYGMSVPAVALFDQYYRMITAAFLHAGMLHIALNMWALFMLGPYLEQAFGHLRFAGLYLLSALGGSVMGYWFDAPNVLSIGASGAIFGLFGAIFVVGRRLNLDIRPMIALLVLNLVITFWPGAGISWTAHIGGLITGVLVAGAIAYAPKNSRTMVQTLALAGMLGVLLVLVVVRTAVLTGTMI
ncbi:Membrane associated serine protease, rhomboid family [Sinosporangium album]|uniref:Membrane associated serine protease, rhomboid family n=1 Tax=Sinosporangium album TaxID=504805 RepID=A0A1G8FRT8_9ACTN|nr:rhomboid family intramembrane serine protease [Sinosporangium album]SDH84817.1 Membrane associated serine protease, rhomboid family [Sinosporangium album]